MYNNIQLFSIKVTKKINFEVSLDRWDDIKIGKILIKMVI